MTKYPAECENCVKPINWGEPLYIMEDPNGSIIKICKVCLKEWKRYKKESMKEAQRKLFMMSSEKK